MYYSSADFHIDSQINEIIAIGGFLARDSLVSTKRAMDEVEVNECSTERSRS